MADLDDNVQQEESEWLSVLLAYYQIFCNATGGFYAITEENMPHDEFVLAELSRAIHEMVLIPQDPLAKPVCKYLQTAISNATNTEKVDIKELAKSIYSISSHLKWQYGYESLPQSMVERFAYTEILGPRGPVFSSKLALGLVLLGPGCFYPEHFHANTSESYICISGECSINGKIIKAGDYFYNPPEKSHYIISHQEVPCLLAYAWISDAQTLKYKITQFT